MKRGSGEFLITPDHTKKSVCITFTVVYLLPSGMEITLSCARITRAGFWSISNDGSGFLSSLPEITNTIYCYYSKYDVAHQAIH